MKHLIVAALTVYLTLPALSAAEDDASDSEELQQSATFTAGIKFYNNRLHGELFGASGSTLVLTPYRTPSEISFMPVVGVKYKDFLLSASYLIPTEYNARGGNGTPTVLERTEADINVGWYFLPSSVVSIGYKRISTEATEGPGRGQEFKAQGPSVGVSLGAPLTEKIGMYSNFAYSRTDTDFVLDIGTVDYFTMETGLAFSLGVRGLSAVLGYRYQKGTTKRPVQGIYTDGVSGAVPVNMRITNVSDGWILGIFGVF